MFAISPFSFFAGFLTATILWWVVSKARPMWNEIVANFRAQQEAAQARKSSAVEDNHRRITLRRAQGMHLAAPLFALEEIVQDPLLVIPPKPVIPGESQPFEDVISQTLPYLPMWPELAAAYHAPAFTLPQALSGNANIVVIGQPGMGKTVALAHLASLVANRSEETSALKDAVPFLLHVADLELPAADPKNVLQPVINAASEHAPFLDLSRLPAFIEFTFKSGNALLLVDGFDEIPPEAQQVVTDYFKLVMQNYSKTRIVTTGAPEYLDGLIGAGFAPLALMAWSTRQSEKFIYHWGKLWSQTVAFESWAQEGPEQVDPLLLNTWLSVENLNLSPLELTLKAWGAYAGDSLGSHVLDAIAAHILRIIPADAPIAALETLAMQVTLTAQPVFDSRKARDWVKSFDVQENKLEGEASDQSATMEEEASNEKSKSKKGKKGEKVAVVASGLLGKMASSGLLIAYPNNKMRFTHPVFTGYLAGRTLTDYNAEEEIVNQPDWSGKYLVMRYAAAQSDASHLVDTFLNFSRMPMHRPLFATARWLRDAPKNAPWRGKIFSALAAVLKTENIPLALRGQAMAAFVVSGDPGVSSLFRQLMTATSYEMVQLLALGCGASRDIKSIQILTSATDAPSLGVRRAACMALVAIGVNEALETVAQILLNGDEDIRRAAAEALANDPGEGHAMLRDGVTLTDILLRRSVVYGLGRVKENWATEILQKIQVEDDQWVVRNAATEVLDANENAGLNAPRKLKAPSDSPWLVEFAAKKGMGISPGTPATDVLLQALKSDDINIRLAALPYLKFTPNEGVIAQLYDVIHSDDVELREVAYNILWEFGASGVKLPHPNQYGYN